jgi:D-alanyl-D-alanine carboxypeptidase/D-alanyl-D-alanine-endopeptidase (penicillin-binding protein 4)
MARIALLAAVLLALLAPAANAGDHAATQRSLARAMSAAGPYSGAYAVDLDSGEKIYSRRGRISRVPASVNKLYTTASALMRFGEGGTLETEILADSAPDPATGVIDGNLYLRGGGDPTFGTTAAQTLAGILATERGITGVTGRVIGDETAWDGLRGGPDSGYGISDWVGPLSALTFNRGRTGRNRPFWQRDPARAAAKGLKRGLTAAGVTVDRAPRSGETPDEAVSLARWASPTMGQLVAATNVQSDNFNAESLLKALGAEFGAGGTTSAGASVVTGSVGDFDASPTIADGSGLSRANRTSPRDVVRLLRGMAATPLGPTFEGSLALAGRTGTLYDRMRGTAAVERCRAKTGTLIGVTALAGYCTSPTGARTAFAVLMNGVSVYGGRRLQDRMAAALARYDGATTPAG